MKVRIDREVSKLTIAPELENLFPLLLGKEYAALREDIAERGIQVPIDITPENIVLCGMNRLKIAMELNFKTVPVRIVDILDPGEQEIHARKDNLLRRQLTQEQASLQRAAIIKAKERQRGKHLQDYPRNEKGHIIKPFPICSTVGQIGKDTWKETAVELGVSKGTLANDVQYADSLAQYPELEPLPKTQAIKTAKTLDTLPAEERPKVLEMIKKPEPEQSSPKTPEEEERDKQLRRAQNFKTNVDRFIDNLFTISKKPVEAYFQGLDEIEWAFNKIPVFAENSLDMINQGIKWLEQFRDEYAKQIVNRQKGIRRVK